MVIHVPIGKNKIFHRSLNIDEKTYDTKKCMNGDVPVFVDKNKFKNRTTMEALSIRIVALADGSNYFLSLRTAARIRSTVRQGAEDNRKHCTRGNATTRLYWIDKSTLYNFLFLNSLFNTKYKIRNDNVQYHP